jgi:hypothetical protein
MKAANLKKEFVVFARLFGRKFNDEIIPCREILEIISLN